MKYTYHIECPFMDGWNASKQKTQGELRTAKDLASKLTANVASFLSEKQINQTK